MTVAKSSIAPDTSELVGTQVKNADDVSLASNSNSDNIAEGYSSVSSNDTHVGTLAEKIAAGNGVTLAETNDGADETLTISTNTKPPIFRLDNDTLIVGTGAQDIQTTIDLATAGNWIGGSSLESASELVHVYEVMASPGAYKLSDKQPQYSAMVESNRQSDMQVNEATYDGTAGQGLNAATVVYDNGTDGDDVVAGMFALIYDDANFTLGRGRGTGAGTAVGNLSVALITATTAGAVAGTLTLEAGHQIAINDDDYIIVVDAGELSYRFDGSEWYRHIGALFNDSSGHLLDLTTQYGNKRKYDVDSYLANEGTDYTTASTSFEDVDAALVLEITTNGGDVLIGLNALANNDGATAFIYFDIKLDGVRRGSDDGLDALQFTDSAVVKVICLNRRLFGIPPGNHVISLQWRVDSGNALLYNGDTIGVKVHPQFWAAEV